MFLPVIIIGGFRSGLFTPTEPGPLLLSMRCLSPQLFTVKCLRHTLACAHWRSENDLSGDVLVASAQVSAWLITIAELPMWFLIYCNRWSIHRVCCLSSFGGYPDCRHGHGFNADGINSSPVLMPLVKEAGIDPIYFGVCLSLTAQSA